MVKNFLIVYPRGASDQLLQILENGLNAEQGGDGGGLGGIDDQGKNRRQEFVAINCGDRLQSENDVGADGVRNAGYAAALDVGNKTLNGRDQVGVTQSVQRNDNLGVGPCRLESFMGHVGVLVDGCRDAATAGNSNQITKNQSDSTSQFPVSHGGGVG